MSKNEELEEKEFFEEDKKGGKVTIIASIVAFLIVIIGAAVFFTIYFNSKNKESGVNDNIVEYSENQEEAVATPQADIIDRNEDEADEVIPTPETEEVEEEVEEIEELPEPTPDGPIMELDVKDYSKVKYNAKTNLSEMEGYFNDNNLEALHDLAYLDRFIAMSYAYRGTTDFAYYGDVNENGEPHGKGIAVYADNQYYCGEWKNGFRDGSGVWVHYHMHLGKNVNDPVTFHEFIGNFKNDLPDGQGQDHYEYDKNLMVKNKNYITNYLCNYVAGYIDGNVYCTTLDSEDAYNEFTGTASKGSFEYISASRDDKKQGPVMTNEANPDNYYWLSEKDNRYIGVNNYISQYK